ncbi:hypothetical protein THAOC_12120 [Thalassiosira oceanica]|uniref:Secreted protein n=1 Tax=Thalassiosira oceanica TaxID=159749 RepID=K0SPH2_THAOC|nr:hypothetical protein THAOC_12120 [Thalassiosira oceanica]|eukprot:EJK66909.1 hypothetical protein THAOC_12120 [Thalassiosira oceanica]
MRACTATFLSAPWLPVLVESLWADGSREMRQRDHNSRAAAGGLTRVSCVEHDAKFVSTGDGVFQGNGPPAPYKRGLFDTAALDEATDI